MRATQLGATVIAATSIFFAFAGAAAGQQPGAISARQGTQPVQSGLPTRMVSGDTTIEELDFPGGTLEQFVQVLRTSTKDPVNVSLQGVAGKLRVDPLVLRQVSVESALRAALGTRANNGQSMMSDGGFVATSLELIQSSSAVTGGAGGGKSVLVVTSFPPDSYSRGGPDTTIDVLSIRSIVRGENAKQGGLPPEVILSAVDSGLRLTGTDETHRPQIDYHKDSGLLLVRGLKQDVALVREIVHRMTEDQQRQNAESRERTRADIDRNAAIQRAQIGLDLAQTRAAETRKRLDEADKLVAAGSASVRDLADARMAYSQAEAEASMAKIEMERLHREAEAGLDSSGGGSAGSDETADLRAELAKALSRIKELEDQAAASKGGGQAKPKGR